MGNLKILAFRSTVITRTLASRARERDYRLVVALEYLFDTACHRSVIARPTRCEKE